MKIVTLNLRHDMDRWEERLPLIVDELLTETPDLAAFQEVALRIHQAHLIADRLNERLASRPYTVYDNRDWGDGKREGLATLARVEVLEHEFTALPEGGRVAQRIRVALDSHPVDVFNTHLHHLPKDEETIRLPQITYLLDWMYGKPNEETPRILVGDLNAVSDSETILKVKRTLRSAYSTIHHEEPATFPTPLVSGEDDWFEPRAIDYIFYEAERLRVDEARLVFTRPHPRDRTLLPSDHYGLLAVFSESATGRSDTR